MAKFARAVCKQAEAILCRDAQELLPLFQLFADERYGGDAPSGELEVVNEFVNFAFQHTADDVLAEDDDSLDGQSDSQSEENGDGGQGGTEQEAVDLYTDSSEDMEGQAYSEAACDNEDDVWITVRRYASKCMSFVAFC